MSHTVETHRTMHEMKAKSEQDLRRHSWRWQAFSQSVQERMDSVARDALAVAISAAT
jgi:hypothetical protein